MRRATYGGDLQRSLYFSDPFGHLVEITAWPTHASTHAGLGSVAKLVGAAPAPPTPGLAAGGSSGAAVLFHRPSFMAGVAAGIVLAWLRWGRR